MSQKELNKPSSYWDKRRLARYNQNERATKKYINKVKRIYSRSNKEVQKMIDDVYKNYSIDTGLDIQKLKTLLSKSETEKTFKELKKQGLDKYVKNNYKSRISRLEQIQAQIYSKAKEIYPQEQLQQEMAYKGVINSNYYKTIYDIEQSTGFAYNFSRIDNNMMDAILSERWSGRNFSERIWVNTDILADSLSEIIGSSLMSGQSVQKTARDIRERFNVAKYYSERLARTEMNYFDNQADMMAYEELGIEEYVLVATLDNRTSPYCIEIDGKHFPYDKIEVGTNYPPFHPNCRCTTRGYLGKDVEKIMQRVARDPVTGEREIVPNMNYKEWYDLKVKKYGEQRLIAEKKKITNKVTDKEQFKRYKKALGKSNVPNSFDKFQEMKYNNASEWNKIKKEYYIQNNNRFLNSKLNYINPLTYEKEFIPKDTIFNKAGVLYKGNEINDINRLVNKYGGNPEDWSKVYANIKTDKYDLIQIHYYSKGNKQYDVKVKTMKYKKGVISDAKDNT